MFLHRDPVSLTPLHTLVASLLFVGAHQSTKPPDTLRDLLLLSISVPAKVDILLGWARLKRLQ